VKSILGLVSFVSLLIEFIFSFFLGVLRGEEPMPSCTAGMFMRADPPLTSLAAAMAKAITAAARALTRST